MASKPGRSPGRDTQLPENLRGPIECLMIDNFDSFTWNLYQQLCKLGCTPVVIRNNVLTPAQLPLLNIKRLIISPGPGHPKTDSGVSRDAIRYFAGKVPILGVCMGLECLVDVFGGEISYAGEIMHGKTSGIAHDGRGLMNGLPQGFQATRYHSLSAHITSLPKELSVCATTDQSGVVMGVRHRKLAIESVQYHPESIMSEAGDAMMKNFLALRGGYWRENPQAGIVDGTAPGFDFESITLARANKNTGTETGEDALKSRVTTAKTNPKLPTILQKIHSQRLLDIETISSTPGFRTEDLERALDMGLAPPVIDFYQRLKEGMMPSASGSGGAKSSPVGVTGKFQIMPSGANTPIPSSTPRASTPVSSAIPLPIPVPRDLHGHDVSREEAEENFLTPALLAEIKRASPSKGLINGDISAPAQALKYALGGASAISVLTEPKWFKGKLSYLHFSLSLPLLFITVKTL
jgi:anthranilate synthase/aminodeoxychorismate synthase-like glutamine amidotransferase